MQSAVTALAAALADVPMRPPCGYRSYRTWMLRSHTDPEEIRELLIGQVVSLGALGRSSLRYLIEAGTTALL